MSYEKQNFTDGQVLTAEHLNHMENGICRLFTEGDIPKVFFSGNTSGMTKDRERVLQFSYKSKTDDFGGYVKMKWQGSSTLAFPKKNFTIKMFTDETCETKLKKAFKHWGLEKNKYVLKADYIDHTHARNIVTANLWTEMVACRPDFDSLPSGMKTAPGHGAIDGFPIKLYLNGVYQGIYTWTIGKEDWMFGMDEENANHAALCAEKNNDGNKATTDTNILACEFRANANIDENDWSLEFPDNLNTAIKTSFNNLINCVKDTDDATFKSTVGKHLDLTSAFDYYTLAYFAANIDGLGKNLVMLTYDGVKWFCSAYDMDNIWGSAGAGGFVGADHPCPESYYDNNSLLWQRLEECFGKELYERYTEVRKKVLSYENVVNKFERFCDLIGTELYAEDVEIYPEIPYPAQNNLKQIRNFFTPRAEYVDSCFAELGGVSLPKYSVNEITFSGQASEAINTELQMFSEDRDFTVLVDFTPLYTNAEATVFSSCSSATGWKGLKLYKPETTSIDESGKYFLWYTASGARSTPVPANTESNVKIAFTHVAGTMNYNIKGMFNGERFEDSTVMEFNNSLPHTNPLGVGADDIWGNPVRPFKGTVHELTIYQDVLTDEEITAFLNR